MKARKFGASELQEILMYLSNKPYKLVYELIGATQTTSKQLPDGFAVREEVATAMVQVLKTQPYDEVADYIAYIGKTPATEMPEEQPKK